MKRKLLSIVAWIVNFLKDLFYGAYNLHADLARILVFGCIQIMIIAAVWNMHLHQPIDLMALGGGLAAILTAGAGFLIAKVWSKKIYDGTDGASEEQK